jgi:outer membrane protein assembly factor BamB
LVALNAVNGKELWSSALTSAHGNIGSIHWQSPIVVNGSVYCSDESGNLTAYSLR